MCFVSGTDKVRVGKIYSRSGMWFGYAGRVCGSGMWVGYAGRGRVTIKTLWSDRVDPAHYGTGTDNKKAHPHVFNEKSINYSHKLS